MATVSIPAEFFRGELRVYGDWRTAFVRELLQNSTDASPTRIDATFSDVDGHGRVEFSDDGHGMSREVLENVFFALGRTTKTGEGSIGGFGRARIIICFAQTRYSIRTGNLLVEGAGGQYTIHEVADYHRGTTFTIDMLDEDSAAVRRAFESLLAMCHIDVPIYLNGIRRSQMPMPGRAQRVMRDSDGRTWGKVYVEPDRIGRLFVRVHGLVMFTRYIDGSDDVILELTPSRSREVLSASRDSLHTVFGEQLDKFVSDLAGNRRRALAPDVPPLDVCIGGGGFMVSDSDTAVDDGADATGAAASDSSADSQESGESEGGQMVRITPANTAAFSNLHAGSGSYAPTLWDEPTQNSWLGFDVYLLADRSSSRVRKLARIWDPTGWTRTSGQRRRALILTWKAAVGHCLDLLLTLHPELGRVMWTVGFTFDDDVKAVHRSQGDGHVYAINPVTSGDTMAYQLSSKASRRQMLAAAMHEVAHTTIGQHDEQYAALLTELMAHVDQSEADRIMRAASR